MKISISLKNDRLEKDVIFYFEIAKKYYKAGLVSQL